MNSDKEALQEEVHSRLNMAVIVGTLFSATIEGLYQLAGDGSAGGKVILIVCLEISLYIITYLLFEIFKNRFGMCGLKNLSKALLFGIGSFLIPIVFIAVNQNGAVTLATGIPFVASIFAVPLTAVAVLYICASSAWSKR